MEMKKMFVLLWGLGGAIEPLTFSSQTDQRRCLQSPAEGD